MSIYLVTGGAGFIGSHLAARLLRDGHTVRVIDNLRTGTQTNLDYLHSLNGDLSFHPVSITDAAAIEPLFAGVDVVFHHAALVSVPESIADPLTAHDICVTGTLNVLRSAEQAGVRRVVYAASSAAYGDTERDTLSEHDAPAPISPYGAAKLAGEYYCRAFAHSYTIETVSLRYFNVFGPRQDPQSAYAAAIPRFIARMLKDESPIIYGTGEQTRDFVYIDNVVHGNMLAAFTEGVSGKVFNLGTGERITLLTLVDMLNEAMGSNLTALHQPARAGDILHSCANISSARTQLGYEPIFSLMDGLRATVEAYRMP